MDQCTVVRPDPKGALVATTATLSYTKYLLIPCTVTIFLWPICTIKRLHTDSN